MSAHITPGYNGWTHNAKAVINAIDRRERGKRHNEQAESRAVDRECAELEYYEENNCYPHATGYFGTETDAHFYER